MPVDLEQALQNSQGPYLPDEMHVLTGVPIVDITIHIDWFTVRFDDRKKVLHIVKSIFNNCSAYKKLLMQHH